MVSDTALALIARLEPRINELARRISREHFGRLPGYSELPGDMVDVEIAETVRHGLRAFGPIAGGDEAAAEDAFRLYRERSAQRAREGMPLALLVHAHLTSRIQTWTELRRLARPGEEAAVLELTEILLSGAPRSVAEIVAAYLEEQSESRQPDHDRRRALVRALLDPASGTNGAAAAAAALGVSGRCDLLVARIPAPSEGTSRPITRRRLENRCQQRLDRRLAETGIVVLDGEVAQVLLIDTAAAAAPADNLACAALAEAYGQPVTCALAPAEDGEQVPRAAATAREILRIAEALGRGPGLYRLEDVALEYHLSRPAETGPALSRLLEPVLAHPELAQALRAYIAHEQDRRATATELNLHPNTVDNRVRRAGRLMGTDLTTPRGYALALTALTAHDLGAAAPPKIRHLTAG